VVTGGWPFFETAARGSTLGVKSIFIDAGAVLQDALPDAALPSQLELRRIRQLTLPLIDRVFPISDFIRSSQTELDRGSDRGVRTVLLGADHMSLGTFTSGESPTILETLDAASRRDEQLLLVLGRFELTGYKNSLAAYELLRLIKQKVPRTRLLILDAGQDCQVPRDLAPNVELLGAPADLTLQEIMRRCAAGVSMSLWEGFNLPLAEMQWLARPVFAFNIGAHPEIVADPWLLSDNLEEMAAKAVMLLEGRTPLDLAPRFVAFRERRPWSVTLAAWQDEIVKLAAEPRIVVHGVHNTPSERRVVLADVTNASLDPANPGVIRVTRRLCAELQQHPSIHVVFTAWKRDASDYVFLDQTRRGFLEAFGGPKDGLGLLANSGRNLRMDKLIASLSMRCSQPPVLFMPEVIFDGHAVARANWAGGRGFKTAAILYDLIPIFHKELCGADVTGGFPEYLDAVAQLNAVWSISQFTLSEFNRYLTQNGQSMPAIHEAVILPGQFGELPRNASDPTDPNLEIRILCLSTLEPRKNHLRLVDAFQALRSRRPELPLRLVLVGNRYAGAPEIAAQVQSASKKDPSIEWRGITDDASLASEFVRASFTVYPSLIEGFGLPILESLWMGRPCLTHNGGVMEELARGGGCMVTDMRDTNKIMRSLELLAADRNLRVKLGEEAKNRQIATWQQYSGEIAERLVKL
jgi:glycosyltransferase involved in cell wall biosynthesis